MFLPANMPHFKADAEDAQSHLKCGRAEASSGGMTVESGWVGVAVCHLRGLKGSCDQRVDGRGQTSQLF